MPLLFFSAPELVRILMTTSSVTARLLSLAVLVLTIAPLGSIYVLLFSLFGVENEDAVRRPSNTTNGTSYLQDLWISNVSLEDVWVALLNQYPRPIRERNLHHLRVFLPWFLCFVLGVVVPATLSIWSFFRDRRLLTEKGQRQGNRRERTLSMLKQYTKELKRSDVHRLTNANDAEWYLPKPGRRCTGFLQRDLRSIVGNCAICLGSFELQDKVVWSANPACVHCFHARCIGTWEGGRRGYGGRVCP